MPLSTLDPQSALVVIDLQVGIAQRFDDDGLRDVVTTTAGLAQAFRAHNRPVVLVNVDARRTRTHGRGRPDQLTAARSAGDPAPNFSPLSTTSA